MCLVALAIDQNRRFPLVVATNRDEFFQRPATRLAWWTPPGGGPDVLGGRDLESGGTWLGLTAQGRLALLTNIRDPSRVEADAPSRGRIVPEWLAAHETTGQFWMRTALSGHNGFNLIAADFRRGECFWASNMAPYPLRLERGVYGLSNAGLDTPWPKVQQIKGRLRESLAVADSVDTLAAQLFAALAEREPAADDALPSTGVRIELERQLSPAFIRTPDQSYGTRCSTLIITERAGRHPVTHVLERTFSATGGLALLRRSTLRNWPPRYTDEGAGAVSEQAAVAESELFGESTRAEPVKRTRVRSLLKPDVGPRKRSAAARG
ncbi:MAG: NRDE family protein [Burkholderiales bacterium]|nr:NRDE family protein [Burkholderiales bacterium]